MHRASIEGAADALRLAREELGPESERALSSPEAQALVLSRARAGATLLDSVLWFLHREARSDARVADEFVAFFLSDLLAIARPAISPGLRRFLDSGDLVQSVLGDLWRDLGSIDFESRASFLAFLTQRLRWKATDEHRSLNTERRGGGRLLDAEIADLPLEDGGRSPQSECAAKDDWESVALRILRLPERDRLLVRMQLRGDSLEEMGRATGSQPEATRKALQRALTRLRAMR